MTIAAACLVDRSGGTADLGVPLTPLLTLDIKNYPANPAPHLAGTPAIKPGSRDCADRGEKRRTLC